MPARRRLALLAAPAAVLLLAGAACSDDDSSDDPTVTDGGSDDAATSTTRAATDEGDDGGAAAATDPCSLLSPADLQDAFGSPWDDGEAVHQEETGGDQCTWTNLDAPPVKTFSLVVYTNDSIEGTPIGQGAGDVAGLYELNKGAVTDPEDLDIGDEAFRSGTNVWALDGDTLYNFSTFLGDSEQAISGLETLAEKAVDG